MENYEVKPILYHSQSGKKTSKKDFLEALFGSGSNRVENALQLYQRAGNLFTLCKNWLPAGTAYMDAAKLCNRLNDQQNAVNLYIEAANCLKKNDQNKTVQCLLKAIEISIKAGHFTRAADCYQMIGQLMEENENSDQVVHYYEEAACYYQRENNFTNANKCLTKLAEHAAISKKYCKAIGIFEDIARFNTTTSMSKQVAMEYFFRAALCHLCSDSNVKNILKHYVKICPDFENSKVYKFIIHLAKCLETCDAESFKKKCTWLYGSSVTLSPWLTSMLSRIKRKISQAP